MAIQKAMFTGVENVMNAYDDLCNDVPYYSVWSGRTILFSWNEDDIDKGKEKLRQMLLAAEQNEHNDILTICFHPKKEKNFITDKTPVTGSMTIRVTDLTPGRLRDMDRVGNVTEPRGYQIPYELRRSFEQMAEFTQKIPTLLSPIEERLAALELGGDDVEEQAGIIGIIKHLENPGVQMIANRILDLLIPGQTVQQPLRVSGVPGTETATPPISQPDYSNVTEDQQNALDQAIITLSKYCNVYTDLPLLANLAENNTQVFNMMLSQLKNQ